MFTLEGQAEFMLQVAVNRLPQRHRVHTCVTLDVQRVERLLKNDVITLVIAQIKRRVPTR